MGRKVVRQKRRAEIFTEPKPAPPKAGPIEALNKNQADYILAIDNASQIFTVGPAGTGKTYIAAYKAADALLERRVKKIILTRPAVGAGGEDFGFLPGKLEQKLAPWALPFTEKLQERMGHERFQAAMRRGEIEIAPLAFMRGRTFDDSFVVLDEAQNTSFDQIKMFLTRIGQRSTVIVNGDVAQTDLKAGSGLKIVLNIIERQELDVLVIEFTSRDVVRSGICRMWTNAFERHEKTNAKPE
jgi:phosphate starvation-inducible PhoH-like protein